MVVQPRKSRSASALVNFTWTFVGSTTYAACQWAMLAAVAKLGTPGMVGQFALAQTITIPIYSLTNLQLRAILATDASNRYKMGTYIALRYVTIVAALVLVAAVTLLSKYRRETAMTVLVFGAAKAIESISDILHGLIQQRERMDKIAVSLSLKGLLSLISMVAALLLFNSVMLGVVAMTLSWIVVLALYDRRATIEVATRADSNPAAARHLLAARWDYGEIRPLLHQAAPLGFAYLLIMLGPNIPRYLLERSRGEVELGLFAALVHLTLVGYQVVGALGQSASPRIAQCYCSGDVIGVRRWMIRLVTLGGLM